MFKTRSSVALRGSKHKLSRFGAFSTAFDLYPQDRNILKPAYQTVQVVEKKNTVTQPCECVMLKDILGNNASQSKDYRGRSCRVIYSKR